jgi:hypothetical protein
MGSKLEKPPQGSTAKLTYGLFYFNNDYPGGRTESTF